MAKRQTGRTAAPRADRRKKPETMGERATRENIARFVDLDPRTQGEIAKAAGIDPSRFTRSLAGAGFTMAEVFHLSTVLDVPVRTLVSIEGEAYKGRPVPMLKLAKFPTKHIQEEALNDLIRFRHGWGETNNTDPRAYMVDIDEAFSDVLPGDIGIFSDSKPAAPDAMMIVVVDGAASLATCVMVGDVKGAALPSKQVRTDFEYWGSRIELIRK